MEESRENGLEWNSFSSSFTASHIFQRLKCTPFIILLFTEKNEKLEGGKIKKKKEEKKQYKQAK